MFARGKINFALLTFIFLSGGLFAQGWEPQNSGTTLSLLDVYFVDQSNGWVVGDSAIIIHTTDGGQTWETQSSPVDSLTLNKVQFLNTQVGYIVATGGTILSTKNGGQNWRLDSSNVQDNLVDLSFINADTGWVAGYDPYGGKDRHGIILHTQDGGLHWETVWNTENLWSYFYPPIITDIEFANKDTGFAIVLPLYVDSGLALVYRTTDGGQNWDSLSVTPGEGFSHYLQVFGDTLWIVGFRPNISTNGGLDWQLILSTPDSLISINGLELLNGHTGWILGDSHSGSVILVTTDGGASWTSILSNQKPWIKSIFALDKHDLWAVGNSGTVIHYSNELAVASRKEDSLPTKYALLQNHPNPFNSATVIQFTLPKDVHIQLSVFDILGREVMHLTDKYINAGHHEVIWNGKASNGVDAPSGIYVYRLNSAEVNLMRKMLLLR